MNPHRIIRAGIAVAPTIEAIARLANIRLHMKGYAEPDYDDPKIGIVAFGDFNEVELLDEDTGERCSDYTPPRISLLLHRLGVETEQADEWAFCSLCGKAVRTRGHDSFWRPSWFQDDLGRRICHRCVQADPSLFLAQAEGRGDLFLTFDLPLADLGYACLLPSLEYFPENQTGHDPHSLASSLRQQGLQRFILQLINVSEDDGLLYRLWLNEAELEAQPRLLQGSQTDEFCGASPTHGPNGSQEDQ